MRIFVSGGAGIKGLIVFFVSILWHCNILCAVVLHPQAEPGIDWPASLPDNVVGKYLSGSGGNCVVISPNYVLLSRHQGGSAGSKCLIGSVTYTIEEIYPEPSGADLRVAKLYSANLMNYIPVDTNTSILNEEIVITGFGYGRSGSQPADCYQWDFETQTLRFGSNVINSQSEPDPAGSWPTYTILADFDQPKSGILNLKKSTEYEAVAADKDSGSGWFRQTSNGWVASGLTRAIDAVSFENKISCTEQSFMVAVELAHYSEWINSIIENDCTVQMTADLNTDCAVNIQDLMIFVHNWQNLCTADNNFCTNADFVSNQFVDFADFAILAENWLNFYQP